MIMTNTKQCRTCIYGEKWSGVYTCGRCFEKKGYINQDRIPNRTESECFDYIKKGTKSMNAIIVDKKEPEKTVETTVETVEKADDKPKKETWTDEDIQTLIHFYNKGTKGVVLADMFGVTRKNINTKIFELKRSERWGKYFTDKVISKMETPMKATISKTETVAEPETVTAEVKEISPITAHIKDLKAYFADFVIEKCKREVVPDAVEFVGAYIKYLEEKVNE